MMRDLLEEFSGIPVPIEEPVLQEGEVGISINDASDAGDVNGNDDVTTSLLEEGKKDKMVSMDKLGKMGKAGFKAVANFITANDGDDAVEEVVEEPRQKSELEIFFEIVSKIRENITVIQQSTAFIKEMTADMQEKTLSDSDSLKRNRMFNKVIKRSNELIKQISESVKNIKKYNDEFAKNNPDEKPLIRIRANIHGTLCKNFRDTFQEFTDAQESQKRIVKEKLVRQFRYIDDRPPEEIEKAIDEGNTQVFKSAAATSSMTSEEDEKLQKDATQALAYVENKHNEIVTLTNSVKEVHQLFQDLAILVDNQGEIIDDIEENCRKASEYVEKGVENLHEAHVYQKKARKKMFWMYGLILAIFGVLIVGGGLLGVFF